ncbi:hypothetical protein [Bradyrhizobium campsiandrae]|uniref:hypothetical protein n=1 Tax=Bradyrhizobium campsiandrae TaxID=1729892 RepID=UPI001FCEE802|nr:hypothetical protein [Bradyrhizobium campsiandrae]
MNRRTFCLATAVALVGLPPKVMTAKATPANVPSFFLNIPRTTQPTVATVAPICADIKIP